MCGLSQIAWSQKGCNISASEVRQVFLPNAEASAVPGNPCRFSFFEPQSASHGTITLEIRPQESSSVSNDQFANQVADIKSHMLCRMELDLGARAAFCYSGRNAELLILHGGIVSAILVDNGMGPNPTRNALIELAKIVFNVQQESAPLEKPRD
jgi:hypothetical protein